MTALCATATSSGKTVSSKNIQHLSNGGGGSKSKYPAEWLHSERPAVSGVGTNAVIKDFIPLVSASRI